MTLVHYTEPTRFTDKTNVTFPIGLRALRAGMVAVFDWATLHYYDHAPGYVVLSTAIIAVLILAVIESRDWLRFKGRGYFLGFLTGLLVLFVCALFSPYAVNYFNGVPTTRTDHLPTLPNRSPVPPFINPLHDPVVKWRVVHSLRNSISDKRFDSSCHINIVRYQDSYAEDLGAELKDILFVAGLSSEEHFATRTIPKNVTVRAIYDRTGATPPIRCANEIDRAFFEAKTRLGNPLATNVELITTEPPDFLTTKCPSKECIEIDIGNEDTSR